MDLACFGPSNFVKTSPEGKDENKTSKNMKFNFGFTKKVRVPEKKTGKQSVYARHEF